MLASTAESVGEAVASLDARRWKVDGIRIQLHRRADEVRVYSRNLNEITPALPGIVDATCGLAVEQAVLDGEALWIGERGPAAFQETVAQIDSDAPPEGVVTFLFDLLHVVGDDLLDSPLEERGARLARITPQLKVPASSPPNRRRPGASSTSRWAPAMRASSSRTRPRLTAPAGGARRG
jgi:DNA ligase-1